MLLRLYRRLYPFAKPYRGKVLLSSILNILSNTIGSVNLLALLPIVSIVLGESSFAIAKPGQTQNLLEKFSNYFVARSADGTLDQTGSLVRIALFIFITFFLKNVF